MANLFAPVPRRNAMAPPQLPRDAPGLDILEPLEMGLFPILRDEPRSAVAHGRERWRGQRLRIDIPLISEPRLDDNSGTISVRHHMNMCFNLVYEPPRLHHFNDALARLETVEIVQRIHVLIVPTRLGADGQSGCRPRSVPER